MHFNQNHSWGRQAMSQIFRLYWVVPEKIHTPPKEEISVIRRGRGDKIVSDNNKCIRTLTSNFLRGGGMDVFWNDHYSIIQSLHTLLSHQSMCRIVRARIYLSEIYQ